MSKRHSAQFIAALLVTTAMTVPAYAEIETVVVTAERKAEDIQTVPVAVTALTGADLKAKQVDSFRDLQFHVPSVTYTKTQFGGAQFQIRGITTQFGLGAAIAQNENDIYLEAPALVTGQYYDLERLEVARGPQSTSYGRAATGGAVNIITAKPNLDEFQARASFDFGSYTTMKPEVMINIPIIEGELGFRFAALGNFHDGYEKNTYAGPQLFPGGPVQKRINDAKTASGRASLRWQPNENTTVDLIAEYGWENDSRVRGDAQLCHRDLSGVMGCLPDQLAFEPSNTNSNFGTTFSSKQGILAFSGSLPAGFLVGLYNIGGNGAAGDPAGPAGGAFNAVGGGVGAGINGLGSNATTVIPHDILSVNTAFNPVSRGSGGTYMLNWSQTINSWLKSTVDVGYSGGNQFTQQSFLMNSPENISTLITSSVAGFNAAFGAIPGGFAADYNTNYFTPAGTLPLSNVYYNGKFGSYGGIIDTTRGGILNHSSYGLSYDEDQFSSREWTGEVRFATNFDGPLNFTAGAFYMSFQSRNQYWVVANSLDMDAIILGAVVGSATPGFPHLVAALPAFDSEYQRGDVMSRSAFLEGKYEVIPDTLTVTAGARYNDDRSSSLRSPFGAALVTAGYYPIGSTNVTNNVSQPVPFYLTGKNVNTTDKWTGRVVVDWTPKLSWSDQTLVYGVASRGELAGGINTSNVNVSSGIPQVFQPATVDAIEVGTKNTFFDGSLQANLDAWYYNYENYQLGIIVARQAVTFNIPASLFGMEGELVWQPDEDLAFNATISLTRSQAGNAYAPDQRNPTNGQPNSILVKDLTTGANCVVVPITAAAAGHTPGESNGAYHVANFYLPNGGNAAINAPYGVPLVNYGLCAINSLAPAGTPPAGTATLTATRTALRAAGFDYAVSVDPHTGVAAPVPVVGPGSDPSGFLRDGTGIPVNVHGNRLPQVPNAQIGFGAQYTAHFGEYTLVPRIDYYWQSATYSRVWNDNADRVNAWDTMNAQIQLNAPDSKWYARVFATNVFDKRNITGAYLQDASAGLWTNVFAEDPRVVGISLGASW